MANYYYFVPSLPSIRSDSENFMAVEDFLALCREHISARDYSILEKVALTDEVVEGNSFVEGYTRFRNTLDRLLAHQRALSLGLRGEDYPLPPAASSRLVEAVRKAVSECDPLEGERLLLALHFEYLDRNVGFGHQWDLTYLISYALRLKLLSRRSAFSSEKGRAEFDRLFAELRNEIFS